VPIPLRPRLEIQRAPGALLLAHGIGVRYDLNVRRRQTIGEALGDVLRRQRLRHVIWALRDVNLRVERSDAVGIVGRNGAGKTTLMLALAGILTPDEGLVEARGKVSALLSLGAGFDPDLSGRENVELALAFMGVSRPTARSLLPRITKFADLGEFIDARLKTYSTGMRARLGFAVATCVDPEVLLIDEVLSTGDLTFRERSRDRIEELVHGAAAAVIVTHDLGYVVEACTRALWLDGGRVAAEGEPRAVVQAYLQASETVVRLAAQTTRMA